MNGSPPSEPRASASSHDPSAHDGGWNWGASLRTQNQQVTTHFQGSGRATAAKRPAQKGAALVEVALTLPFVVTLFIGLLDLALFFYQRTQVQLEVHAAAQSVVRNRAQYAEATDLNPLAAKLKKGQSEFRLARESDTLRIDASQAIIPMLRPLTGLGFPSQVAARAVVRLK